MIAWMTAPAGLNMEISRVMAAPTTLLATQSRIPPITVSTSPEVNWAILPVMALIPLRATSATMPAPRSSTPIARSPINRAMRGRMFSQVRPRNSTSGRSYVIAEDVRALAGPVLTHRMLLDPDAEIGGATAKGLLTSVMRRVQVPQDRVGA